MDRNIETIAQTIKANGGTITFGQLFQKMANTTDALSALLHTAKKRGMVGVVTKHCLYWFRSHTVVALC